MPHSGPCFCYAGFVPETEVAVPGCDVFTVLDDCGVGSGQEVLVSWFVASAGFSDVQPEGFAVFFVGWHDLLVSFVASFERSGFDAAADGCFSCIADFYDFGEFAVCLVVSPVCV